MTKRAIAALGAFLVLTLPVYAADLERGTPEQVGMSSERLARLNAAMEDYVEQGKLAGVVTLVAREGKIVTFNAVGQADLETDQPMTRDTIVRMFSMSKPITSVAVMMLYEQGRFLLTDPISKYIPELKGLRVYVSGEGDKMETRAPTREVTIHDLLTHQSGFTYGTEISKGPTAPLYNQAGVLLGAPTPKGVEPVRSLTEFTERLSHIPLAHDPGAAWSYGVSTDVLCRLVEVVSGQPLDVFLQQHIFGPLGMKDTGFWVPGDKIGRFSAVYVLNKDGQLTMSGSPTEARFTSPPAAPSGGGGLVSTASDYARFCQMLLNGGELDGVRLLSPKTVDLMTMNNLPKDHPRLPTHPDSGFGLGFAVLENVAQSEVPGSVGEYSWAGYASTDFWIDPKEKLIGIVLAQLIPYGTYPLRDEAKRYVYQAIVDELPSTKK